MRAPYLVVLAGRPGTGKTTLARALAGELGAAYVRIDAIETAVVRCGLARHPVGPVGYVVGHEIAAATLALGTPVVIDAVNPVPEARAGWPALPGSHRLVVFETVVPDEGEHRRRVTARRPDLAGQTVPTWPEVVASEYVVWDEARDGTRVVIDMTDTDRGLADALGVLAAQAVETAARESDARTRPVGQLQRVSAEQRDLLEQLSSAESRERMLLAEAVHDDPLQLIAAALLRIDAVQLRYPDNAARPDIEQVATLLGTAMDRLRTLIVALTPPDLDEGLGAALRHLADGIFIGTSTQIAVRGPSHLPLSLATTQVAHRILREALVNVREHAQADHVTVTLDARASEVVISVVDDGVGSADPDAGAGHLGLVTMYARARAEGALLDVTSGPGRGTSVVLSIPRQPT